MSLGQLSPPPFVRLAGHPLRWRLLGELARSDRRVRELVTLVDQPQNLVSYHLGRLRADGLVAARRSSFDGRDAYYHLDLARCADALAAAGTALHPGLRLRPAPPAAAAGRRGRRRCRVLFLCTGNSARSPAAEALLRHQADGSIELAGRPPKHLSVLAGQRFDYVITLCDRVREVCPEFPGRAEHVHWSIPDPAAGGGDCDGDTYPAFERMAAELDTRIGFLLAAIRAAPANRSVQEA